MYRILLIAAFLFFSNNSSAVTGCQTIEVDYINKAKFKLTDHLFIFEDTSSSLTIKDILNPSIQKCFEHSTNENITPGFTQSAFWLKFAIHNNTSKTQDYLLELKYPIIKEVFFYKTDAGKILRKVKTGDNVPYKHRQVDHRNFVFELSIEPGGQYAYYLRGFNQGETLRFPIQIYTLSDFFRHDYKDKMIIGAFYGLLIFVVIFNIFLFITLRSKLYLYYALYVTTLALFLSNVDGISFKFFWPGSPWFANHSSIFFISLANLFLLLFSKYFLNTKKYSPRLDRVLQILMYLSLLIFVAAIGRGQIYLYAVITANLFSLITIITVMLTAFSSISKQNKEAYYFISSFIMFMFAVMIYVLRNLGVITDNIYTTIILKFGFASEVLLLTFAIIDRFKRIKNEKNLELERLVKMRTEEIKSQNEEIRSQSAQLTEANEELEKLSLVASETDNGVTIFNKNGGIEWQNKGFEKLFGYTYKNKKKQKITNVFGLTENINFGKYLERASKTAQSVLYETEVEMQQGRNKWIQTNLTPITDIENNVVRFIAVDSEITKIKQTEKELLKKNQDVTASILTAKKIQQAVLPPNHEIKKLLPNSFIFFRPKDIVSGDYYWIERIEHNIIFAAVDCTGHGVPGAFMSVVGVNLMSQAVKEHRLKEPSKILNFINEAIIELLSHSDSTKTTREGMDLALCSFNFEENKLLYSGAKNPLYRIRDQKLDVFNSNYIPIGLSKDTAYKDTQVDVQKQDMFYLFSDGFADQFGGEKRKKYLRKNFKALLIEVSRFGMKEQKEILEKTFDEWKNNYEQVDDVLIIGVKLDY